MIEPTQFTVFWAWQSDRTRNHHQDFIREALDAVAQRISNDESVPFVVRIDQDTAGVPGLCDIPATILEKIENADAFVADLTYVARSDGESGRYCSNPNVLFELGYAFHAIGWKRLVCVLNEAHGPATEQIFDLDHRRHPITYCLPHEGQIRREVLNSLVGELEDAIRGIVELGQAGPGHSTELARFIREGQQLLTRVDKETLPIEDSKRWAGRTATYLRENLGEAYEVRFSDFTGMNFYLDIKDPERSNMRHGIEGRIRRLHEFLRELKGL